MAPSFVTHFFKNSKWLELSTYFFFEPESKDDIDEITSSTISYVFYEVTSSPHSYLWMYTLKKIR